MIFRFLITAMLLFSSLFSFAQSGNDSSNKETLQVNSSGKITVTEDNYSAYDVEMADGFRADGKIYVVVAVVLLIFIGMIVWLFFMERKLRKLEDEIKNL